MAGLKQIKNKIRSVQKTRTVTRAMEAVSAVKMRKAQERALSGRAYARAALEVLARASGSSELANHPLMATHQHGLPLYIVITSDKGLAGALNSSVLRTVAKEVPPDAAIIAIGRKANDFFSNRGHTILKYYPNTDTSPERIDELVSQAAEQFISGQARSVHIAYQNFISTFEQHPTLRTVFPLSLDELTHLVEDIVPARGKYAQARSNHIKVPAVYTVEPSAEEILNVVLPKLAGIFVYHALLESQASEHSARMVAMKSASDKAAELTHSLTLTFNKVRQAAITREMSEITGGMEAMAS